MLLTERPGRLRLVHDPDHRLDQAFSAGAWCSDAAASSSSPPGERFIPEGRAKAQDPATGLGKVVRIAPGPPVVWSRGHRNIQAAAIHPRTGALWIVEHGAKGGDEINLVERCPPGCDVRHVGGPARDTRMGSGPALVAQGFFSQSSTSRSASSLA